eukprot:588804-Amphidinium_carterae.1
MCRDTFAPTASTASAWQDLMTFLSESAADLLLSLRAMRLAIQALPVEQMGFHPPEALWKSLNPLRSS